jgi:hypothetical protein
MNDQNEMKTIWEDPGSILLEENFVNDVFLIPLVV